MQRRKPTPTLWQLLADLDARNASLRETHRTVRALLRAAGRRRATHHTKGLKP